MKNIFTFTAAIASETVTQLALWLTASKFVFLVLFLLLKFISFIKLGRGVTKKASFFFL
jgi:hypothetical protein